MKNAVKFFAKFLLFVLMCFFIAVVTMSGSYKFMNRYVSNKKIIMVQLAQNDRVKLHDDYQESIEEVVMRNNIDESAEYIISINEGYKSVFVTTYVSNEERWHKMQIKDEGQGQYMVDFIQPNDENATVTYRIETRDNKGVLDEFYFSYCNK